MTRAENEALAALAETARRMAIEPREADTDHADERIQDGERRHGSDSSASQQPASA